MRNPNKLDAAIDGKFPDNLFAPRIFTDVISDKLSTSSMQDIYTRFQMNLTEDPFNITAPQLVDLGISSIDAL